MTPEQVEISERAKLDFGNALCILVAEKATKPEHMGNDETNLRAAYMGFANALASTLIVCCRYSVGGEMSAAMEYASELLNSVSLTVRDLEK